MLDELKTKNKYVGLKQSTSAIEQGIAVKAFLAKDTEVSIRNKILAKCLENAVPIEYAESMKSLGETCGIDVGAAVVVLLGT